MDPITLLAGASIVGYLYNQQKRELNFQRNNSINAEEVARHYKPYINNSCQATFPVYNQLPLNQHQQYPQPLNPQAQYQQQLNPQYQQPYPQYQQNQQQNQQSRERFENLEGTYLDKKPQETPELDHSRLLENFEKYESMNQNIPSNDLTSAGILDLGKRAITDFEHNNMVPFFGSKVTQSMAGTGVLQGNYIDGVSVDSGFDQSTPWNSRLNDFTGVSENYLYKRETGPLYSPAEQQTGYVFGKPLIREDLEQYKQSLSTTRNDLSPVPSEKVGKGINLDPSIPASGGFHEFTRILPNNVSDYKANQLENRINEGKLQTAGLPTSYPGSGGTLNKNPTGVPKNRPPRDWSQVRRPTMTNKFADVQNLEMMRPDYDVDKRPNNAVREQASWGYGSIQSNQVETVETFQNTSNQSPNPNNNYCVKYDIPVGISPAITNGGLGPTRSETFMSQDNNIRSTSDCNSIPLLGPSIPSVGSNILSNWYVNETDRGTVNPTIICQTGLKAPAIFDNTSFTEPVRTTTRETTTKANIGSGPSNQNVGSKFYTYNDQLKTTTRETTTKPNIGSGPSRQDLGSTSYTYVDPLKTTNKETTNYVFTAPLKDTRAQVETSRFQYTGDENMVEGFSNSDSGGSVGDSGSYNPVVSKIFGKRTGGARTGTIRSSTLVQNYVPTPGRQNILTDPDIALGSTHFGKSDKTPNGAGTLFQAIPNASFQQNTRIMSTPTANPNKLFSVDDRQLASYQASQLINNPLSMFTINPNGEIPSFEEDNEPDDYSDLITIRKSQESEFKDITVDTSLGPVNDIGLRGSDVYPPKGNPLLQGSEPDMSVMSIFDNLSENSDANPFLTQGSSRTVNKNPTFSGKGYSGSFKSGPVVYGSLDRTRPLDPDDRFLQTKPLNGQVCLPNDALPFAGGTLMITGDLK